MELKKSMEYSLLGSGKRFRPLLCLAVAEALNKEKSFFVPFAASVEMVHAYSLIHDDLPCMDNDDFRRGKPTNHKVFGETLALLAGDGLLTESFLNISRSYREQPGLANELTMILSESAGATGMIAGQVVDMFSKNLKDQKIVLEMHRLKTAKLMAASVEGAAVLSFATPSQRRSLSDFGFLFGVAFQIADDILDYHEGQRDIRNIVELLGASDALELLRSISDQAVAKLKEVGQFEKLENLLRANLQRTQPESIRHASR